jgi:RNA polymerase sigma-54 factor
VKESFTQSLQEQLGYRNLTEHQYAVASFLVGSLDDDGYLRRSIDSIVDDLSFRANVETDEDEVLDMLKIIQEFEPAGVGARDLGECLIIQLQRKEESELVDNAITIVEEALEEFKSRQIDKIIKKTGLNKTQVKDAITLISHLSPKPANGYASGGMLKNESVIPDFLYDSETGELSLNNREIPTLKVSQEYLDMLEDFKNNEKNRTSKVKDSIQFTKQKLERARKFIDAVKQREQTLLSVMKTIIDFQLDFFKDENEVNLKPLTMRQVSEKADCDISTVSRVVSSKYIQTNAGIYSLKEFFSAGFIDKSGEDVSSRKVKVIIKEIIDAEDKTKPLSDGAISKKLAERGMNVARRTVAKYREQLSIPVARIRKDL